MKRLLPLLLLALTAGPGYAQVTNLSVGYYSPYVIHPGVSVETTTGVAGLGTSWVARPRLGFFTKRPDHATVLLGTDLAYRLERMRSEFAAGIGYLGESRVLSVTLDLGSGSKTNTREWRHHLVPTIGYRYERPASSRMRWYAQASYGRRMSRAVDDAAIFIIGVGTTFTLKRD